MLKHHRLRPEAAGRAGQRGLHRPGKGAAAQLDRPQRGRGGGLHASRAPDDKLRVYTTRPDTLFGATYMVMSAPSIRMIEKHKADIRNYDEIAAYRAEAAAQERLRAHRAEQGQDRRADRGHPGRQPRQRPGDPHLGQSDYVLMGYGTGAIMAVPAHDDAGLGLRQEVRPAHRRGGGRRRRAQTKPTPTSWTA